MIFLKCVHWSLRPKTECLSSRDAKSDQNNTQVVYGVHWRQILMRKVEQKSISRTGQSNLFCLNRDQHTYLHIYANKIWPTYLWKLNQRGNRDQACSCLFASTLPTPLLTHILHWNLARRGRYRQGVEYSHSSSWPIFHWFRHWLLDDSYINIKEKVARIPWPDFLWCTCGNACSFK